MTLKNQSRLGFGTKILNHKTNEIGLLIYTWDNTFADGVVPFATCVDKNGKKYNIEMDNISPIEEESDIKA
ncbi:MAG: hypothetical protein IKU66_05065 [Clostridia bacterium]|nr:hypothetical protein [Clostridia bacterium]